jgi:hypothetical protein
MALESVGRMLLSLRNHIAGQELRRTSVETKYRSRRMRKKLRKGLRMDCGGLFGKGEVV